MTTTMPLGTGRTGAAAEVRRRPSFLASDAPFRLMTRAAAYAVLAILLGLLVTLFAGAWPAFAKFGPAFIWTAAWNPVTETFGALGSIVGTLVTSTIAMLIAVPVSIGIASFLVLLAPPWMRRPVGTAIELLAAIPSIIYGMWGLLVFAPFMATHFEEPISRFFEGWPVLGALFAGPAVGVGVFTAAIVLAIMVIPFIAAVMRDVFEAVPTALRESAFAIGATTWEVVRRIMLPYTRVSLLGAIMLGLGRALGETMAVTFVIGNAHGLSASLFQPGNTIASTIANEFTEAYDELHTASLIALGLLLFVITFIVLAASRLMLARMNAAPGVRR